MQSLTIIGRRWFQKSFGNTYHTVKVLIDGAEVFNSPKTYGYGEQYEQTAQGWLEKTGRLPGLEKYNWGGAENLRQYCERNKIAYSRTVADVNREKDL